MQGSVVTLRADVASLRQELASLRQEVARTASLGASSRQARAPFLDSNHKSDVQVILYGMFIILLGIAFGWLLHAIILFVITKCASLISP